MPLILNKGVYVIELSASGATTWSCDPGNVGEKGLQRKKIGRTLSI